MSALTARVRAVLAAREPESRGGTFHADHPDVLLAACVDEIEQLERAIAAFPHIEQKGSIVRATFVTTRPAVPTPAGIPCGGIAPDAPWAPKTRVTPNDTEKL